MSFRWTAVVVLVAGTACGGNSSTNLDGNGGSSDAMVIDASTQVPGDSTVDAPDDGPPVMSTDAAEDRVVGNPDSGADTSDAMSGPVDAHIDDADAATESDAASDAAASSDAGGCSPGCDAGKVCAYLIADGCSAVGTCATPPTPGSCGAVVLEVECGCSGSNVSWVGGCKPALPDGYAPAPISHSGVCGGAASDH